jgi:hypothetical protein
MEEGINVPLREYVRTLATQIGNMVIAAEPVLGYPDRYFETDVRFYSTVKDAVATTCPFASCNSTLQVPEPSVRFLYA